MKNAISSKLSEFLETTVETLLALASLSIDALFWVGWAWITKWSGNLVTSFQIANREIWPYVIAQWCGCGVLALFAFFRTVKDSLSLYDSFVEYLEDRKISVIQRTEQRLIEKERANLSRKVDKV